MLPVHFQTALQKTAAVAHTTPPANGAAPRADAVAGPAKGGAPSASPSPPPDIVKEIRGALDFLRSLPQRTTNSPRPAAPSVVSVGPFSFRPPDLWSAHVRDHPSRKVTILLRPEDQNKTALILFPPVNLARPTDLTAWIDSLAAPLHARESLLELSRSPTDVRVRTPDLNPDHAATSYVLRCRTLGQCLYRVYVALRVAGSAVLVVYSSFDLVAFAHSLVHFETMIAEVRDARKAGLKERGDSRARLTPPVAVPQVPPAPQAALSADRLTREMSLPLPDASAPSAPVQLAASVPVAVAAPAPMVALAAAPAAAASVGLPLRVAIPPRRNIPAATNSPKTSWAPAAGPPSPHSPTPSSPVTPAYPTDDLPSPNDDGAFHRTMRSDAQRVLAILARLSSAPRISSPVKVDRFEYPVPAGWSKADLGPNEAIQAVVPATPGAAFLLFPLRPSFGRKPDRLILEFGALAHDGLTQANKTVVEMKPDFFGGPGCNGKAPPVLVNFILRDGLKTFYRTYAIAVIGDLAFPALFYANALSSYAKHREEFQQMLLGVIVNGQPPRILIPHAEEGEAGEAGDTSVPGAIVASPDPVSASTLSPAAPSPPMLAPPGVVRRRSPSPAGLRAKSPFRSRASSPNLGQAYAAGNIAPTPALAPPSRLAASAASAAIAAPTPPLTTAVASIPGSQALPSPPLSPLFGTTYKRDTLEGLFIGGALGVQRPNPTTGVSENPYIHMQLVLTHTHAARTGIPLHGTLSRFDAMDERAQDPRQRAGTYESHDHGDRLLIRWTDGVTLSVTVEDDSTLVLPRAEVGTVADVRCLRARGFNPKGPPHPLNGRFISQSDPRREFVFTADGGVSIVENPELLAWFGHAGGPPVPGWKYRAWHLTLEIVDPRGERRELTAFWAPDEDGARFAPERSGCLVVDGETKRLAPAVGKDDRRWLEISTKQTWSPILLSVTLVNAHFGAARRPGEEKNLATDVGKKLCNRGAAEDLNSGRRVTPGLYGPVWIKCWNSYEPFLERARDK
ncbi:hypothetical protein BDK51DRAFT_41673 [Blyttiomyces helicus]|uniref:Uncharacterized protein n=1 Tax=Blyttiomyces helicus TaxID=388810 RepID=A0A4P9WMC7_9FUNG|nr:hypothetical protein BDK51DRAFT_41673 [Blyttiomyces helicus]|eukprot:RKO94064.1 hypothetical protein BDK51DRAFT_41673 [Blyttiomyces helicus]